MLLRPNIKTYISMFLLGSTCQRRPDITSQYKSFHIHVTTSLVNLVYNLQLIATQGFMEWKLEYGHVITTCTKNWK